jgi:cytochrome c-type biogenesis protein CcmH
MGRHGEARYQRARGSSARDLRARALREYLAMADAERSRPDGLLLASETHFKMQQNAHAMAVARRAYERFPHRPETREQFAALLILANDRKGAAALCQAWLKDEPNAGVPLRMLGRIAANDLRFDEAAGHFEQAIAREPENVDFMIAYGEVLLSAPGSERLPRAVELLARAATLAPGDPRARYHLGIALMRSGRDREASRQLLRTLDLDPYRGPTYSTIVQLARRLREPGPAALFGPIVRRVEDRLREELTLWRRTWDHPDAAGGYLALARFLVRTAEPRKAEAQLEEALRLLPGWPEASAELLRVRRLIAAL